jgi:bacterioferritin (cytochrome b1)
MAPDEPLTPIPSRRAFLRTGVALAGGSSLLSACGGGGSPRKPKLVAGSDPVSVRLADISILNEVLDLEHAAIAAYTAGIPLLAGHARAAAVRFLGQELSHAGKLESTIKGAGGKPNPPRTSYDLGRPRTGSDVLEMLRRNEASLVSAYLGAIPELMPGWLRAVAAGILANEGQHVCVLRAVQGLSPVPSALVTGSE